MIVYRNQHPMFNVPLDVQASTPESVSSHGISRRFGLVWKVELTRADIEMAALAMGFKLVEEPFAERLVRLTKGAS